MCVLLLSVKWCRGSDYFFANFSHKHQPRQYSVIPHTLTDSFTSLCAEYQLTRYTDLRYIARIVRSGTSHHAVVYQAITISPSWLYFIVVDTADVAMERQSEIKIQRLSTTALIPPVYYFLSKNRFKFISVSGYCRKCRLLGFCLTAFAVLKIKCKII